MWLYFLLQILHVHVNVPNLLLLIKPFPLLLFITFNHLSLFDTLLDLFLLLSFVRVQVLIKLLNIPLYNLPLLHSILLFLIFLINLLILLLLVHLPILNLRIRLAFWYVLWMYLLNPLVLLQLVVKNRRLIEPVHLRLLLVLVLSYTVFLWFLVLLSIVFLFH